MRKRVRWVATATPTIGEKVQKIVTPKQKNYVQKDDNAGESRRKGL